MSSEHDHHNHDEELTVSLGGDIDLDVLEDVALGAEVSVPAAMLKNIAERRARLEKLLDSGKTMYGINTGFGHLASCKISRENLKALQVNLIRSHACGVGEPMSPEEVRALMFARVYELARGFSGVRPVVVETLVAMLNKNVIPYIPRKGSVGASGDLAPSAHMALVMIGEGMACIGGDEGDYEWKAGAEIMKEAGIAPIELAEKEGLALINGTQAMKAVGGLALQAAMNLAVNSITIGAMTAEALKGTPVAFDKRIHDLKPHAGQKFTAEMLRDLLTDSEIRKSHAENDDRVQDPYCLRCMPQAVGAVLDALSNSMETFETELQSVTDNPLIVDSEDVEDGVDVLSGGNFHGQPLSFAADFAGIALTALGNMSERRISQMVSNFKILPPFLARNPGLESGFMIAHVTAAALCNENKVLSHPASADSVPTSANQEDFVSMGMNAANKLVEIVKNTARILAIEALAAAEGMEYHRPLKSSRQLEKALSFIREIAPAVKGDDVFSTKIENLSMYLADFELDEL